MEMCLLHFYMSYLIHCLFLAHTQNIHNIIQSQVMFIHQHRKASQY